MTNNTMIPLTDRHFADIDALLARTRGDADALMITLARYFRDGDPAIYHLQALAAWVAYTDPRSPRYISGI